MLLSYTRFTSLIRRCSTAAVTKTIATSPVSDMLDYCNSILYNIPNREINELQSVQNFRKKYKICTLTHKVIHTCQPVYLQNLLKPLNRIRNLRSSDDDQLVVPRVSSKTSERAFSVEFPQLWNCIPLEIKNLNLQSFRKKLKTLYFGVAFLS